MGAYHPDDAIGFPVPVADGDDRSYLGPKSPIVASLMNGMFGRSIVGQAHSLDGQQEAQEETRRAAPHTLRADVAGAVLPIKLTMPEYGEDGTFLFCDTVPLMTPGRG